MPYTILIVDDSATMRAMIKRTVKMCGLCVENLYEAADGKAALEVMNARPVDLVLADLNMPVMSGIEMTQRMREQEKLKGTPVLVITAEPNVEKLEQLKHGQIQGYLRKPFTPEAARDAIARALETRHAA